jgi:hypothetical protein
MSVDTSFDTRDPAAIEQELQQINEQIAQAEDAKQRLEKILKKKQASDKQRRQRLAALAAAGKKRRAKYELKLAGLDTGEAHGSTGPPVNADWIWGMAAIAAELNVPVVTAGNLFRKGKLGDAVVKLGARTIRGSCSKLANLPPAK